MQICTVKQNMFSSYNFGLSKGHNFFKEEMVKHESYLFTDYEIT